MFQRLLIILAVVVAVASIQVGCRAKQEKKTILTLTHWEVGEGENFLQMLAKTFESKHPGVKINLIQIPYTGGLRYRDKLLTMFAGNTAPDIMEIGFNDVSNYVRKGVLLNIEPYLKKSKSLKVEDFFPVTTTFYRFDGTQVGKGPLYGFPKDWSTNCMFYNKDLFDKCGVPYPKDSLTWEEFLSMAQKLTRVTKEGRTETFAFYNAPFYSWVYQNGGNVFSPDGKKCLLDQPEAIEALKFMVSLSTKYKICPVPSRRAQESETDMFQTGRIGIVFGGRWYYPFVLEKMKNFRWGIAPDIHHKNLVTSVGANGYGICATTKHPELAWEFFEFLVGKEGQIFTAEKGWNIPSDKEIANSVHFLENPKHPSGLNKIFLDEAPYARAWPISPWIEGARWESIYSGKMDLVYLGKLSVEDAVRNITNEINKIIKENITKEGEKNRDKEKSKLGKE